MSKAAELAKMGEVLTNSQIGGRRNLIINGAYQIAQRGTSSTVKEQVKVIKLLIDGIILLEEQQQQVDLL